MSRVGSLRRKTPVVGVALKTKGRVSMSTLDRFANNAAETAMQAAAKYLQVHDVADVDAEAACKILREEMRKHWSDALDDARDALEANMFDIAEATFAASMRAIGVSAAKRYVEEVK